MLPRCGRTPPKKKLVTAIQTLGFNKILRQTLSSHYGRYDILILSFSLAKICILSPGIPACSVGSFATSPQNPVAKNEQSCIGVHSVKSHLE